jgi:hypothetical protein
LPAKSRKQQRALYAKFGSAWVHEHHFDKLAPKAKAKPKKRGKK